MKHTILAKLLMISTAAILTACGGGGDSGSSTPAPTYGSIAVNIRAQGGTYVGYNGGYIVSNRTSQASADADALAGCRALTTTTSCSIALQFGQNTCGALARSYTGTSGIYGTGSNGSGSVAEATALQVCKNNGGVNCTIPLSLCNGSGTPALNILGAVSTPVESSTTAKGTGATPSDENTAEDPAPTTINNQN